ncbi:MAG: hypothetical protein ABSG43_08265 [Solirubrobacteraceae bacterium]|jgi:hypothetical protein
MGSTLKFESDRRELVRERRHARIERKQQRRQAREDKRSQPATIPDAHAATQPSVTQRAARQRLQAAVDQIVNEALDRHDQLAATASAPVTGTGENPPRVPAGETRHARRAPTSASARSAGTNEQPGGGEDAQAIPAVAGGAERAPRVRRRERDLAEFRDRRQKVADEARDEAGRRIARSGGPACVADALAALAHASAAPWGAEREQLQGAIETGRVAAVGAVARRALWAISRDAARSSRRAKRDPELALAACVAYALIARLPRTVLRSAQRARPAPRPRPASRRAFWR